MRVHFSWVGSKNPYLSFGKAGKHLRRVLGGMTDLVGDEEAAGADLQLWLGIPLWHQRRLWQRRSRTYAMFTMTEIPGVHPGQIKRVNDTDGLLTPCAWCDEVYKQRGTTVPRFVVPLGVEPNDYPLIRRSKSGPFTFLWVGVQTGHVANLIETGKPTGDRKRGWLVRQAFEELRLPQSRLILKTIPWPDCRVDYRYRIGPAEVHDLSKWLTEREYLDLLAECDVLVWPTWGEGFGLPPLEAAATGLPAIMPNYSGMTEYWDDTWCVDLPFRVDRVWRQRRDVGACIDIEVLKERMVWAYENQAEVRWRGEAGSKAVHENWTWDGPCREGLGRVLDYYGGNYHA